MASTGLKSEITDAEWEVMRVVWAHGRIVSREVVTILESKMEWKKPTIKTLLGRLVQKGALATKKQKNRFIYTAEIEENDAIRYVNKKNFDRVCNKNVSNIIGNLIEDYTLSFADIEQLEKTLKKKKKEAVAKLNCRCVHGQCSCERNHHGNKVRGVIKNEKQGI